MDEVESTESEEATESGETQEETGFVELTDAKDEELEAFLSEQMDIEAKDGTAPESLEPDEEEAEQEAQGKAAEGEGEQSPQEQGDSDKPKVDAQYIKQLEEQRTQQEKFIKARNNEIGEERKARKEAQAELEKRNAQLAQLLRDEDISLDPSKVVDTKLEIQQNESKVEALSKEDEALTLEQQVNEDVLRNQKVVEQHISKEDWQMENIVRALQDDGVAPEHINQFAQNPYAATDGLTLVQLAKRAKAETALRQLAVYAKQLMEENQALKDKPRKVLEKVEQNLKKPTAVTSKNGGGGSSRGLSVEEGQIHSLSDEEIESLLASAQ